MTTNEPAWESLDQMAQATAAGLAQAAAGSAFHLFRDKQFRRFKGSGLASKHQDASREPGALRVWLEYVICEF